MITTGIIFLLGAVVVAQSIEGFIMRKAIEELREDVNNLVENDK